MIAKGFELMALSSKGEKAIKKSLNANKKYFEIKNLSESGFVHYEFMLKKLAILLFKPLREQDFERELHKTMSKEDVVLGVDYDLRLIR